MLRRSRPVDALVVLGTRGNVPPINELARAFPGRKLVNNLHRSEWIDRVLFDRVCEAPAASDRLSSEWSEPESPPTSGPRRWARLIAFRSRPEVGTAWAATALPNFPFSWSRA
jgi:hypothetical protein